MITFQTKQGQCVPVVVCNICQEEIEGADTTDLLYRSMCDLAAVQHFHPGVCHDQALAGRGVERGGYTAKARLS